MLRFVKYCDNQKMEEAIIDTILIQAMTPTDFKDLSGFHDPYENMLLQDIPTLRK